MTPIRHDVTVDTKIRYWAAGHASTAAPGPGEMFNFDFFDL